MADATNATNSDDDAKFVDADNKNAVDLRCRECNMIIVKAGVAQLVEKKLFLHYMTPPADSKASVGEDLTRHWVVNSRFDFENVSVTKPVASGVAAGSAPPSRFPSNMRYLACESCDKGPIGVAYLDPQAEMYYVSYNRIKHASDQS